jgi:Fe-S-cluster containining protein
MRSSKSLLSADRELVQIVDAALADSARRSGAWLACHLGCNQCCMGVFAISQLDVLRLKEGMAELDQRDPNRAKRVRTRARDAVRRLSHDFPGDVSTGILDGSANGLDNPAFEDYANDEPCPVLDPETGGCDLYTSRPMTCRVFGPPVRTEEGIGICQLCYKGATGEQIAACELHANTADLEADLLARVQALSGKKGDTIVAFALTR